MPLPPIPGRTAQAPALAPLSKERIEHVLTQVGYKFGRDSDDDVYGVWESGTYYFFATGPSNSILDIHGYLDFSVPRAALNVALLTINRYNSEKRAPKLYLILSDQEIKFHTQFIADFSSGCTDDQIRDCLEWGVQFAELASQRIADELAVYVGA